MGGDQDTDCYADDGKQVTEKGGKLMVKAVILFVVCFAFLATGLMILLLAVPKDPYFQALEDEEQMKWIQEHARKKKKK